MKVFFILCSAVLISSPSWAINKCKTPDGQTVFQDAPCTGQGEVIVVRPGSGHAQPSAPAPDASALAPKNARKEGAFGASWQRRTYLENRGVADARAALDQHVRDCAAKQHELANRKRFANDNVAGATWELSISTEMQAAATVCDSRERQLRTELESLEKELRELQAKGG